jgi:hypothetical protein
MSPAVAGAGANGPRLAEVVSKAVVAHTITYFVVGIVAYVSFDYTTWFAEPQVAAYMRQTSEPIVMAGPLFQPLRGALFGLVFHAFRAVAFRPADGCCSG